MESQILKEMIKNKTLSINDKPIEIVVTFDGNKNMLKQTCKFNLDDGYCLSITVDCDDYVDLTITGYFYGQEKIKITYDLCDNDFDYYNKIIKYWGIK